MKKLLGALAISMVSATAMAQDKGWYVGGSFGQSKAKDFCSGVTGPGVTCDDTEHPGRFQSQRSMHRRPQLCCRGESIPRP